jgi:uncharacterized protein Yka (UPF0111/DUF47 family)
MNITDNMHDLSQWFQNQESYHDFEGMADAKAVLAVCKDTPDGKYIWDVRHWEYEPKGTRELARSLLLSYLYERADTYGIEDMTHDKVIDAFEALLHTLTGGRWFSKVTDEMITQIENSTDED